MNVPARAAEEARAGGFGLRALQTCRRESEAALKIVARVPEQQLRAYRLRADLADAFVRRFFERDIEEGNDAKAPLRGAFVAQRQKPHVATTVGRHEDDVFNGEAAPFFPEGRHAGLVGDLDLSVRMLERGEAGGVHVA